MIGEPDKALTRGERANLVVRAPITGMKLKCALLVLDQFTGQHADCWPRMATLARAMGCTRRTARAAISELRALGIVEFRDTRLGFHSRRYRIRYDRLAQFQRSTAADPLPRRLERDPSGVGNLFLPPAEESSGGVGNPFLPLGRNLPGGSEDSSAVNKQTTARETPTEHAAEAGGVSERAAQGPVCLLGSTDRQGVQRAQQLIRAKLKAIELLKDNLIWDKAIGPLLDICGQVNDGNPLPRVMEVIEMADLAKPKLRGAWIKEAIEKGWKPGGRRMGLSP